MVRYLRFVYSYCNKVNYSIKYWTKLHFWLLVSQTKHDYFPNQNVMYRDNLSIDIFLIWIWLKKRREKNEIKNIYKTQCVYTLCIRFIKSRKWLKTTNVSPTTSRIYRYIEFYRMFVSNPPKYYSVYFPRVSPDVSIRFPSQYQIIPSHTIAYNKRYVVWVIIILIRIRCVFIDVI